MGNINIIDELKNYLKNTPKEQQQKDWDDIKAYGEFGPTVDEFLYKNPIAPPYNSTVDEFDEFANAMDREEEIHNKANAVFNNALSSLNESTWGVQGFIEGAEWADANPSKKLVDTIIHQYIVSCDKPDLSCLNDRLNWIMETYWKN